MCFIKTFSNSFFTLYLVSRGIAQPYPFEKFAEAWNKRATVRFLAGDQRGSAERIFSRIIERAPEFAEAWNKRATVRFIAGDHRGSAKDIAQVLQLEPRHFGALSGLGMIHMHNSDWQNALKTYELAFSIHPYLTNVEMIINDLKTRLKGRAL